MDETDSRHARGGNGRAGTGHAPGSASAEDLTRFELLRSAMYHDRRETALRRADKCFSFLNVLLGSAAVAAFTSSYPFLGQALGFIVAGVSAAQLVWDPSGLSRDHRELRKRFYTLLSKVEGGAAQNDVQAEMMLIYADEPPLNRKANERAHDQAGKLLWGDDFHHA